MAAGGVTVGSVWLDVMPSMRNFGSTLVDGVEKESKAGGARAGAALGDNTEKGFKGKLGAITAVGATIGVGVAAALTQAMDLEQSRAKLAAQLGLNSQEAQRFGKVAGDLYSSAYGESMDQVNEAIVNVSRNIGGLNDADLSSVSGTVLNLANTFGVDLQGATAAVGTAIKSGLAPDAKTALDFITAGFQGGVDKAGDFLDTITEYGVQFQKLGLDGQVATGLLSQGLEAGARSADLVADSIKEFSIRAVDGSKTTSAGFQAIGLDAQTMAAQIAQGGPAASAGLDTVLDRLRAMPDPVARSQAAVALFGTQAEDLGDALYALDPSSAIDALGGVAGAADAMNTTLGETAASRLEGFTRSLQTGLVDFLGGTVLPVLNTVSEFGSRLFGEAWGPVREFLGWLAGTGGVVVGVILAVAAAVNLWTWANTALNLSFLASPITWIVLGILALIAVVIWAWNNFEGFRNVVLAVWSGIQTAASVAWSILSAIFTGIWTAVQAVGSFFLWLWSSVVSPVFNAIGLAARILVAVLLTVLITPIMLGIQLLAAILTWWWENITWPVFQAIGAGAAWLWNNLLMPIFSAIGTGWGLLMNGVAALWATVLKPAWDALAFAANWLWATVLAPVFGLIGAGWQLLVFGINLYWQTILKPAWDALAFAANWLWANVLSPVFGAIGAGWRGLLDGINWVWQNVLKPALDAVGGAFNGVWTVVNNVVTWIGNRWNEIKELARGPVFFVVDTVFNHGIRPVWNGIAKTFNLGQLDEVRMATGGVLPGYTPGRDVHRFFSPTGGLLALSGGEGILVPEAVRALGAGFVGWANRTFSGGRSSGGPGTGGSYADGGIWDAIVGAAKAIPGLGTLVTAADAASVGASIVTGGDLRKVLEPVLSSLTGNIGQGGWADALRALVTKTIDTMAGAVDEAVPASYAGGGGGGAAAPQQVTAWILQALGFTGTPASWLGPLQMLIMRESGGNPRAINLWDSNAAKGTPSGGLMQTIGPTFAANRDPRLPNNMFDPLANIVAGINYIKRRYGSVFNVQQAVGATPKGYDSGGLLPPGWSSVYNGTGRPEPVLTGEQWDAVVGGDGGSTDEYVITSGWLDVREDGLVRLVDGRLRRVTTSLANGRRA